MEISKAEAAALEKIFRNFNNGSIVMFYHCYDRRLTRNGGIQFFEEETGLSEIDFYRDSRAGGIRELADGKPEVQKNFMRSLDIPIKKQATENIEVTIIMQPHNDCGDYRLAYDFVSPFDEPTSTWSAYREKMFQINHMDKAEIFIRKYYREFPHINFKFIHTRTTLIDKDAENIRFDVLKIR